MKAIIKQINESTAAVFNLRHAGMLYEYADRQTKNIQHNGEWVW